MILPLIPDPADVVIQGEQTVFNYVPSASMLSPVLQGQVIGNKILGDAVPRAMIGFSELYGVPKLIGPIVMPGGEAVMLDIGAKNVNMLVDPTQTWLYSKVNLDATGAFSDISGDLLMGALEPDYYTNRELIGDTDNSLLGLPTTFIPREEILRSGLAKRVTCSDPPFKSKNPLSEIFIESSRRWFIAGVTKDNTGVALGTCRVVVMLTEKIVINPDILANPIVADVTSDGSGNYSVQVNSNRPFQMLAYKSGSPDVAGLTVNTVIPTDG